MMFEKNKTKQFLISVFIFLTGMLNVSIAGVFGGYYCSTAAIIAVLSTIYVYEMFDKKINVKENIPELSLIGIVTFLNIVFFLINDVFDVRVYSRNNFNFLSILVIVSQLISIGSLVYTAVTFVTNSTKEKVEVVEESKKKNVVTEDSNEKEQSFDEETSMKDNQKVEIKVIEENKNDEKMPPFMEEEK